MGADQAMTWVQVAERVAAMSGPGVIVLNLLGFMTGWLYGWPFVKALTKDRDFYKDLHFKKEKLMMELGGGDA